MGRRLGGLLLAVVALGCGDRRTPVATVIVGATVYDGSPNPPRQVAVRVEGDRVVEIAPAVEQGADWVIDGTDLLLVPGFVELATRVEDLSDSGVAGLLRLGITTAVVEPAPGGSLADRLAQLDRVPVAVNVASFAAEPAVESVAAAVDSARARTFRALDAGAMGVSVGGGAGGDAVFTVRRELALAVAAEGGRYRARVGESLDAVEETIRVGRDAGVAVHLAGVRPPAGAAGWSGRLAARLDTARARRVEVSADVCPGEPVTAGGFGPLVAWPWTSVCVVAAHAWLFGPADRGLGPLPLEEAIRRASSLPALSAGLRGRGVIRQGAFADLVLLDPAAFAGAPGDTTVGAGTGAVRSVWVNGELAYDAGAPTVRRPGLVLRRGR